MSSSHRSTRRSARDEPRRSRVEHAQDAARSRSAPRATVGARRHAGTSLPHEDESVGRRQHPGTRHPRIPQEHFAALPDASPGDAPRTQIIELARFAASLRHRRSHRRKNQRARVVVLWCDSTDSFALVHCECNQQGRTQAGEWAQHLNRSRGPYADCTLAPKSRPDCQVPLARDGRA